MSTPFASPITSNDLVLAEGEARRAGEKLAVTRWVTGVKTEETVDRRLLEANGYTVVLKPKDPITINKSELVANFRCAAIHARQEGLKGKADQIDALADLIEANPPHETVIGH